MVASLLRTHKATGFYYYLVVLNQCMFYCRSNRKICKYIVISDIAINLYILTYCSCIYAHIVSNFTIYICIQYERLQTLILYFLREIDVTLGHLKISFIMLFYCNIINLKVFAQNFLQIFINVYFALLTIDNINHELNLYVLREIDVTLSHFKISFTMLFYCNIINHKVFVQNFLQISINVYFALLTIDNINHELNLYVLREIDVTLSHFKISFTMLFYCNIITHKVFVQNFLQISINVYFAILTIDNINHELNLIYIYDFR